MRLIDADALVKILESIRIAYQLDGAVLRENAVKTMIDIIANPAIAPSIEAEPVRIGKWDEKQQMISWCNDDVDVYYTCSVCEADSHCEYPYCPNCGAKMDLK